MKLLAIIIGLSICYFPISGKAQINVSELEIRTGKFTTENTYIYIDYQPVYRETFNTDTIEVSYSTSVSSDIIINKDTIIYDKTGYDNFNQRSWSRRIGIVIDTFQKIITSLLVQEQDRYQDGVGPYWTGELRRLVVNDVPYTVSKSKDSLWFFLDAPLLRQTNFIISRSDMDYQRHSSYGLDDWHLISIPDNSFIKLLITGRFPLSIPNRSAFTTTPIILDKSRGLLGITSDSVHDLVTINCYDILGRKFALEVEYVDQRAAWYSIKVLPSNIYFIHSGHKTSKFFIP
ncbi:MAG TPA: hypothetical protein VIX80_06570 [Candidatus Kapabacteria bacterium]